MGKLCLMPENFTEGPPMALLAGVIIGRAANDSCQTGASNATYQHLPCCHLGSSQQAILVFMASADEPTLVDEFAEDDSGYEDNDEQSQTTSLKSAVATHVYENGRRYHSYRHGTYW